MERKTQSSSGFGHCMDTMGLDKESRRILRSLMCAAVKSGFPGEARQMRRQEFGFGHLVLGARRQYGCLS